MHSLKNRLLIDASQYSDKIILFLIGPAGLIFLSMALSLLVSVSPFQETLPETIKTTANILVIASYSLSLLMFAIGVYLTVGWLLLRRLDDFQRLSLRVMFRK